jgi:hypothetical protein
MEFKSKETAMEELERRGAEIQRKREEFENDAAKRLHKRLHGKTKDGVEGWRPGET